MVRLSLDPLLSLFLTTPCPLCHSPGNLQSHRPGQPLLCPDCQQQLQDCQTAQTDSQASQLNNSQLHISPWPITSWGRYEGKLKRAIAQLKYHNTPALAQPLGEGLAATWLRSQQANHQTSSRWSFPGSRQPWVVPVPMHPEKQRQRGFNQAELIARSFCRHTGLPLLGKGLQRIQATQAQFELSPTERQRNVAQAFALGPALQRQRPRSVLLLDDIYTTGATVGAIAQVLAAAKVPCAGVAVVARAML